jgi:NTE family protein
MQRRIGLALSGGGVRAMVFHAGVLQWLATHNLLEHVSAVSSVSGGTLVTGLVHRLNDWQWPTSERYLNHVLPELRKVLTTVCLQREARTLLISKPKNWRYLFSRANVLALAIERCWGVDITVAGLASSREWSINGTTAETGRRFRFKQGRCGDYETGYASSAKFLLAEAMAASAAYPLLIGPLRIDAANFEWFKRPTWGGSSTDEQPEPPKYDTLHIMDGGVYDNLGMEPFFDTGHQKLKDGIDSLIASDAGAAFQRQALAPQWRLRRLSRILEISMDQTRALRVRSFVTAILRDASLGRYYQIGSNPEGALTKFSEGQLTGSAYGPWLSNADIHRAATWPTDLKRVTGETFDLIARHGYETAAWNEILFAPRDSQQTQTDSVRGIV